MKASGDEDELERIIARTSQLTSIDFSSYKLGTLGRRVRLRAALRLTSNLGEYAALLESNAGERAQLLRTLLVKTTSMFRDPEVFTALRQEALPLLFADRKEARAGTLRAWVPACSTGEEAYSIAMCLDEARSGQSLALSVLASDVDRAALERVPRGVYPQASTSTVPPELGQRWLENAGHGHMRVRRSLASIMKSALHDLTNPTHPAPAEAVVASFDIISCRNLLIYLRQNAQERLFRRFLKAATPRSLLILGRAESPPSSLKSELTQLGPGLPLYWIHGVPTGA